ncbi:MAG: efflux RND transporter periplasmic adaptor subunit [Candidatus Kapabacteria bacterium]|nr:efflux RND transporter periplasmic adaptor subunit [Candidatus Kapabacteria bacterium]
MKMKLSVLTIIIPLILVFQSCNKSDDAKDTKSHQEEHKEKNTNSVELSEIQFINAGIILGNFENIELAEALKVTGILRVPPQNQASVSSFIAGIIKSIDVSEGAYINKGQILASISHPDIIKLQQDYLESKSNLEFLQNDYDRQLELQKNNVNAGKTFQDAQSKFNIIKAKVASLEHQLTMLSIPFEKLNDKNIINSVNIKSPISGYIGSINIKIGSYIEPNKEIFSIIDNNKLHIDLNIYEKDMTRVQIGQKVNLVITNQPNKHIEAKIFSLDKSFANESKSIIAHADICSGDRNGLIAGMFLNAIVHETGRESLALPEDAVVRLEGKEYIFITIDDCCAEDAKKETKNQESKSKTEEKSVTKSYSFKLAEVKTGTRELGFVQILPINKIPDGSQIAIKGAYFILSQLKLGEGGGCVDDI